MTPSAIDYGNLPVQADVVSGILRLDPESTTCFRELDGLVRSDPGVAMLVLRVVNSPFYSRGHQVATIPRAINVLGFDVVRSLALLAFSRALFAQARDPVFRLHLWEHSLLAGLAGRDICTTLGGEKQRDEAFVAGLMHDIGAVLMFTHDPARYRQALSLILVQGLACADAERHSFGFDRFAVGREAVMRWKLPERFADFMGNDPSGADAQSVRDPVRHGLVIANCLAETAGIGAAPSRDAAGRAFALTACAGDAADLCVGWLAPDYLEQFKSDDVFKLFASP